MDDVKRDKQMRVWVRAAKPLEQMHYSDVVMWGVAFNLSDESQPPVALFSTEDEAQGYAALRCEPEWHVGPFILTMQGRNSIEIPEYE